MSVTPDPREARLPQWAGALLTSLRSELRVAEDLAQTAALAATVAREQSTPAGCNVTYDGADGESYGLPGISTVRVGDVEVELTDRGVTLDVVGRIVVEPIAANSIRVRSAR